MQASVGLPSLSVLNIELRYIRYICFFYFFSQNYPDDEYFIRNALR